MIDSPVESSGRRKVVGVESLGGGKSLAILAWMND